MQCQDCSVKIAAKILTTRLQADIPKLIDLDQTGFIKGRTISENFVYATELVQVCHKRKIPTMVLKLDFAKAFDTVNWDSLMLILEARGFSETWRGWIHQILATSLTAVLVNGCPGPWFSCRRGLRQGDPLSPYLFLLVADVLQTLIKHDGGVRHPADQGVTCPILQYADDTLILLRGDTSNVSRLKHLLDQFSAATGLLINYDKSTVVPMHMEESTVKDCLEILGCRHEGFPQTYLGLPLSCDKLKIASFDPYICRSDRYLAGWQAALLNPMGRTVLINSVIGGQLTHLMSAIPLPPGAIAKFDKRRRNFLWTGQDSAAGANCLVAWDKVRLNKDQGGLGIKDLSTQNSCLLLKLIHRLHQGAASSWALWVRDTVCLASLEGPIKGHHWDSLKALLPIYRAITTVRLGDGRMTSFWDDMWNGDDCLADRFPALRSHCTSAGFSVQDICTTSLDNYLVARLSTQAQEELCTVNNIISLTQLSEAHDTRLSPFVSPDGRLNSSLLYRMLQATKGDMSDGASFIWGSRAPPRVKFFGWLLLNDRVQSKANLQKKTVVQDAKCDICHASNEDADHIMFRCQFAQELWSSLGFLLPPNTHGTRAAQDTSTVACPR